MRQTRIFVTEKVDGRGRWRGDRGRGQRANSWLQGGRRYISNGSRHSTSCEIAPEPYLTLH